MGITSLQVCMDSSDWLQGTIPDDMAAGMDSSSPIISTPSGEEMLACGGPLMERRLRPPHEQSLKCPRCESTHTKFCYYNNYSLSQPRYFCKTCRRYWTKGGTLRNIPVGGGCRKNKKVSSSKKPSSSSSSPSTDHHQSSSPSPSSSSVLHALSQQNHHAGMPISPSPLSYNNNPTDLHLSFPDFSSFHAAGLFGSGNPTHGFLGDDSRIPIDFMENKYEALLGGHDGFNMGNNGENFGGVMTANNAASFNGVNCSPFGSSLHLDHHHGNSSGAGGSSSATILESCQRLMMQSYHQNHNNNHNLMDQINHHQHHEVDVKPNAKILSLEWHDHQQQQPCNSDINAAGYNFGGLGSWTGLMNGYGSSAATNPLV